MDWKSAITKDDGTVAIPGRWLHLHYYEALNILFRMENALRVFVYVVLKNRFHDTWAQTPLQSQEGEQSTIAATAAKRRAQAQGFGYLGYEVGSPLMYLNSGELARVIISDTHWDIFKPFFRGKRDIIKSKLDEIGTVRNALAHFRPLKYDDIELIKQNVKHAFVGIEQCLTEMTGTHRVVPTNTEQDWYKSLMGLGSDLSTVKLFQNASEKWIRIVIQYACPLLANSGAGDFYRSFTVANLMSAAIIKSYPVLARRCTFLAESIPYTEVTRDNNPQFAKHVSLVFVRQAVEEAHAEISDSLKEIILRIDTETELLIKDNLARGDLIDSAILWSFPRQSPENKQTWWSTDTENLKSHLGENAPPEYWGEVGLNTSDFIAGATRYPWMPSDISKPEWLS